MDTHPACFDGSTMEGFVSTVLPYNASGNPACGPYLQGSSWAKREGRFMTPQGLNYLELCKAILSQVNPAVPTKATKANTKECGVQVNAKVEKTIQCSLGPKTLFSRDDENPASFKSPKSLDSSMSHGKARCNTPVDRMRFLRPVSIYSPVFDRRICLRTVFDDEESDAQDEAAEKPERDSDSEADQAALKELNAPPHRAPRGSNFQVGLLATGSLLPKGATLHPIQGPVGIQLGKLTSY